MIRTSYGCLKTLACAALILSLTTSAEVLAQELNLFEGVQNAELTEQVEPRRNRDDRATNEPQFTLVGTSRIGNSWKAMLRTSSGDTVAVRGASEDRIPIPGYNGYFISNVEGRRVAIAYPPGAACADFSDKGVLCTSDSSGALSLTTAAPVIVADNGRNGNGDRRSNEETPVDGSAEEPSNPFAAALRAAANQTPEDAANRRAEAQRFQMRRIDPSEVPPGQRLVRTPFGDRLIDE
jgi:hypothetical protein